MIVKNRLIQIFYILLAISLLFATITGIICLTVGWEWIFPGHDNLYYIIMQKYGSYFGAILTLVVLIGIGIATYLLVNIFISKKCRNTKHQIICISIVVGVLALLLRIPLYAIFGYQLDPSSDSGAIWQFVKGWDNPAVLGHYTFFPAYLNYGLYMKVIAALSGYKYSAVALSNVLINSASASLIAILAYQMTEDTKIALVSGIVYAIYLPAIIYTVCATPEHQCIFFMLASINTFIYGVKAKKKYVSIISSMICGILAGISNSFKSFVPIVLVAVIVVYILSLIGEKASIKKVLFSVLCLLLIVSFEVGTNKAIMKCSEKIFSVELDDSDALPHFLTVGLNREGEGQIHIGSMSRYYITLRENGTSAETAKEATVNLLVSDWKSNKSEFIPFLIKKSIWAWQDDYDSVRILGYASGVEPNTNTEKYVFELVKNEFATAGQLMYLVIISGCLIVMIRRLISKYNQANMYLVLNDMIIYGYVWLVILSEAQSRYKCLVLPFLCILFGNIFANSNEYKKKYDK